MNFIQKGMNYSRMSSRVFYNCLMPSTSSSSEIVEIGDDRFSDSESDDDVILVSDDETADDDDADGFDQ